MQNAGDTMVRTARHGTCHPGPGSPVGVAHRVTTLIRTALRTSKPCRGKVRALWDWPHLDFRGASLRKKHLRRDQSRRAGSKGGEQKALQRRAPGARRRRDAGTGRREGLSVMFRNVLHLRDSG